MLLDGRLHLPQQRLQPGLEIAAVGGGILVLLLEQKAVLFEHLLGQKGLQSILCEPVSSESSNTVSDFSCAFRS